MFQFFHNCFVIFLKYLEVCFRETETVFDKMFFEGGISLLVVWAMRIAEAQKPTTKGGRATSNERESMRVVFSVL